jgi:hypothetical protein
MKKYHLIILCVFSIVLWACSDTSLLVEPDSIETQMMSEQTMFTKYGSFKRIQELEKMYYEIEEKRNEVDDDIEYILGNDKHIIINAYYHTQIMILHELKNQWK